MKGRLAGWLSSDTHLPDVNINGSVKGGCCG
jgi:hypothetical protein